MTHPNEELLREVIAAIQRGDMAALQSNYFVEDIRYHVPGRSPVSGDYQGTDEVLAFFGRLFELSGGRSAWNCTTSSRTISTASHCFSSAPSARAGSWLSMKP